MSATESRVAANLAVVGGIYDTAKQIEAYGLG